MYPAEPMGDTGRCLILVLCLVLAAAFAPAALAQPSIPDLPGDVDDRVPDDVTDRLPDGNEDDEDDGADGGLPDVPDLPNVGPESLDPPAVATPEGLAAPTLPGVTPPGGPPEPSPVGSNVACTPDDDHPVPIVLVHGTFEGQSTSWSFVSPALEQMGFCVFSLNYGDRGRRDIAQSAQELKAFIEEEALVDGDGGVLDLTGAEKVSIVGHSQGGLMARFYLKRLGGTAKVDDLIGLSPSNHGTNNQGAPPAQIALGCVSCGQQFPYRGEFTEDLNEDDDTDGDETPGDVSYTQIQTRFDEVVLPYYSAFLSEDASTAGDDAEDGQSYNGPETDRMNGQNTTNFCLQDEFADNTDDHQKTQYDPQALRVVVNALDQEGPADEPDDPDARCPSLPGLPADGDRNTGQSENGGDGEGNGNDDRDDGSNGNGGDADPADGLAGSSRPPAPAVLDALARQGCSPRFFRQNFGPAPGNRAFGRCLIAARLSMASAVPAAESCTRALLSRKRARGKRRSDHAACVLAVTRSLLARRHLAAFTFTSPPSP